MEAFRVEEVHWQRPLVIFADLSAPSDVLWDARLIRAMTRMANFDAMCAQLRGGAVLIPDELVTAVEYGERVNQERQRRSYSLTTSVRFYQHLLREVLAATEPVTPVDETLLLGPGRADWDIFTISHVQDDVLDDLITHLWQEPGFLHAARPDLANSFAYRMYWSSLSFFGFVSNGHVLYADWLDDPVVALENGFVEDYSEESDYGRVVEFYGSLMPERRLSYIPIPVGVMREIGQPSRGRRRIAWDAVVRATRALPSAFSKSHEFDDPQAAARFDVPRFTVDRIPNYRQVEEKVRTYCLASDDKRGGFEEIGIHLSYEGIAALADQLLAVVNDPEAAVHESRVMSDGTLQFQQMLVVSGPRGRVGQVNACWNIGYGRQLQLSTAYRSSSALPAAHPVSIPEAVTTTDDWRSLLTFVLHATEDAVADFVPSGADAHPCLDLGLTDLRTLAFVRWLRKQRDIDVTTMQVKRVRTAAIYGLFPGSDENLAAARACAASDRLRACGVRSYPRLQFL